MITRFSKATCPACGKVDKPTVKAPGNETTGTLLDVVPVASMAYQSYRLSGAELYCQHCGHQFTESIQEKAKGLFGRAVAAGMKAKEAVAGEVAQCATCKRWIKPGMKFCPECGAAV